MNKMKKVLIIFGVLLAMVVLAGAITPAFANDDANIGKPIKALCDEWLMQETAILHWLHKMGVRRLSSQSMVIPLIRPG
jgi:hypothetical protein